MMRCWRLSVLIAWIAGGANLPATSGTPSWVQAASVALFDAQGNLYVAGTVNTGAIPVTPGAFQTTFHAGICGYTVIQVQPPPIYEPIPCDHVFAAKLV